MPSQAETSPPLGKRLLDAFFFLARSSLFRSLARWLNRVLKPPRPLAVRLRGFVMYASTLDRWLALLAWKRGLLEDIELDLLPNYLKPGMTGLDVGANVGLFSLEMGRLVGPTGRVVALEPDPVNLEMLKRNLEANQAHNVRVLNQAASDLSGQGRLFIRSEHSGDSRIYAHDYSQRALPVQTVRLDDLLNQLPGVDFVKIDTQGAETAVLRGMRDIAGQERPLTVFCEFGPEFLRQAGSSADEFLDLVEELGFSLAMLTESGQIRAEVSRAELASLGDWQHINLILSK